MTRVGVSAGICGYETTITVERESSGAISVRLDSPCPMVQACAKALQRVDWRSALRPRGPDSLPELMFQHIRHAGCPVVSATAKAIEVEMGAALPADVHIRFHRTGGAT